jgi:signal transduction histidine kinase
MQAASEEGFVPYEPQDDLSKNFQRLGFISGLIALILGLIVIVGWLLDIPVLVSGLPHLVPAHILSAVCAALLDAVVLLGYSRRWRGIVTTTAVVVALFSILVLIGIAVFLFPPYGSPLVNLAPNLDPRQMAPNSLICLIASAASLLLITTTERSWGQLLGQLLALVASTVSLLAIIGYSYTVEPLYGIGEYRAMSLPGAVEYLLLGIALFFIHPDRGATRILTERTSAGIISRRLYAAALVLPPILGFFSLLGATVWDQYDLPFAIAIVVVASMLLFSAVVATTSLSIDRSDRLRWKAEEALRRSRERLRELSQSIQIMQEEERIRIAREVHDELGQLLTAIKMDIALVRKKIGPESEIGTRIDATVDLVNSTIKTVQRITSELRPSILDNLGLAAAIEWQAREFEGRFGIKCTFDIPDEYLPVNTEIATAVFRIFQETLTNVARHSEATEVRLTLEEKLNVLLLEVKDNGKGMTLEAQDRPRAFGIMGMRERAKLVGGTFDILSELGQGTTVRVTIPLPESLQDEHEDVATEASALERPRSETAALNAAATGAASMNVQ